MSVRCWAGSFLYWKGVGLAPQKPSILESQPAPLLCYKIKDHGLAKTQKPPILDIFGVYLGRSLIL